MASHDDNANPGQGVTGKDHHHVHLMRNDLALMSTIATPPLLSVAETAQILHVSRQRLTG
jgi:hypothetical protein